MRQSTGRGQGLVSMLADSAGRVGRGRSTPSPPVGRSGQGERRTNTRTETGPSPAVTMHLDRQGPAVTYSEATSRPPRRTEAPSESTSGDVRLKLVAREKEKEAARATLERIRRQEREEDAARKKREEQELRRARQRSIMHSMEREGARRQEEYNRDC